MQDLDKKIDFDPDFPPENPVNRVAARQRGLTYNPQSKAYIDEDGCLIRDKFGQPY